MPSFDLVDELVVRRRSVHVLSVIADGYVNDRQLLLHVVHFSFDLFVLGISLVDDHFGGASKSSRRTFTILNGERRRRASEEAHRASDERRRGD